MMDVQERLSHFLLPDCVFKVDVVHGGSDAGGQRVSLR